MSGKVIKVSGPLVVADGLSDANVADVVRVGEQHLVGEILNTTDVNVIAREIKKQNSSRNAYYTRYTGKHLMDSQNWHMTLDTGVLGFDTCAKIICDAVR